jgi:SAM-dependent methyltransferase
MTITLPQRHAALLGAPAAQAYLAAPGFPLPDATAIRRVGSTTPRDFLQTGLLLRAALEETAGIAPGHSILDVGCGWGRLALPLAARLGSEGRYLGMDAAAEAIAWCRRNITEADARFRFHHADIRNSYANPRGRIPAARAVLLPWEERFDRVVAFSLFTHLLPEALARYLAEAARLCRPGGVLVATFFLLDAQARSAMAEGRTERRFPVAHGVARIADAAVPEDAVAYDAADVMALMDAAGFDAEWRPGAWCPRDVAPFEYQDLVVARRRGEARAAGGTRGAVTALSGGAFRGWAREANGAPAALSLRINGETVARDEAVARDTPGDAGAFALAVPGHLIGREVRDLCILAGAEDLPLLARPRLLLADPVEELARAWRIEAVRRGLWRIDSLDWRPDGAVDGVAWAIPPRARMPEHPPRIVLDTMQWPLVPMDDADDALGLAFGLAPGSLRPRYRFRLPAGVPARGACLRILGAAGEAWEPVRGCRVPGQAPEGPLAPALGRLCVVAALRAATGLSMAALAPALDLPADPASLLEATPARSARLVIAIDGLDPAQTDGEDALVAALARTIAPGGVMVAVLSGALGLMVGAAGTPELLRCLRKGFTTMPDAMPGRRMVRNETHLRTAWGGAFEILRIEEGAASGFRDLVVLRRRAA